MDLTATLTRMLGNTKSKWTFTLEAGRGSTYATGNPTLYGHSTYGRGSVLAGQPLRQFITSWPTWEEARAALAALKVPGFRYKDMAAGGTTHIPISVLTAGLPDGPDAD